MNKCIGCGEYFDSTSKYCERCFRIKNYNDYKIVVKDNKEYISILNNINKTNDLVIYVVDIFNIPYNINEIFKYINNKVLLVLTKRDVLPKSLNDEKILDYFDFENKIIISSNKNYNFDLLMDKIESLKTSNNVYVIGYTSSGKSTMINKIIYNYTTLDIELTTSIIPSTTLNCIDIPISNNLTLIDTPGLLFDNNIIDLVGPNTLKKIMPKREIKPITYQIKGEQFININELASIKCVDNNVNLYFSNDLDISRTFKKIVFDKKYNIKVRSDEDLVIYGLGFMKFSFDTEIEITSNLEVLIFTRKSII